ncbi:MAG TPA: hypothetical protein VF791_21720 [Pyrinomonadaceae bacterium]
MRLFVLRRKIGVYWRKRVVRGATALLVLGAAISLQYYLANRPLPVDVNAYKYSPAVAKFKQEELVIEKPVLDSGRILFSLDGKMNEFVDIQFEKARLSEETFALFQDKPKPPPVDLETIDFRTEDLKRKLDEIKAKNKSQPQNGEIKSEDEAEDTKRDENGTCLIFVKAEVAADSKLPTSVRFYQLKGSGSSRDFYMVVDTDLVVSMRTSPPFNKQNQIDSLAPGCGKLLKIGDWEWHNSGFWEIKVIATANSILHFTFLQHKPASLWKDSKELFQPFMFGSKPLQAQAINVNARSGDGSSTPSQPPSLNASVRDGPLLNINNLMVNVEEIQLDFSGKALVQTHGEYVTGNLLDHLKKYPLIAGLFALGNAALLGWLIRIFKGILSGS